jgi:hypothetical protein
VSIGLGFYVGYPVPWPSVYDYPYPYADQYPYASQYPYADPYPYAGQYPYGDMSPAYPDNGSPSGVVGADYGGVSFDIAPIDASVYVDGTYVGQASDFSPTSAPLSLAAGVHHIDVVAPGYQTIAFDVSIVPGQVIPYQGTLSRM